MVTYKQHLEVEHTGTFSPSDGNSLSAVQIISALNQTKPLQKVEFKQTVNPLEFNLKVVPVVGVAWNLIVDFAQPLGSMYWTTTGTWLSNELESINKILPYMLALKANGVTSWVLKFI